MNVYIRFILRLTCAAAGREIDRSGVGCSVLASLLPEAPALSRQMLFRSQLHANAKHKPLMILYHVFHNDGSVRLHAVTRVVSPNYLANTCIVLVDEVRSMAPRQKTLTMHC